MDLTPREPIVVGVYASSDVLPAIRWAAAEAAATHHPLRLVHALPPSERGGIAHRPTGAERAGRQALSTAVDAVRRLAPGVRVTESLITGRTSTVLLDAAAGAWLLVVGRRPGDLVHRLLHGSIGATLVGKAPTPVVIVGDGAQPAPGAPVVVGVDGSAESAEAVNLGAALAILHRVPLELVHAWQAFPSHNMTELAEQHARAETVLATAAESVARRHPYLPVRTATRAANAVDALVSCSASARLLVVGSRGHGPAASLMLGSVSQTVTRRAHCPVLVTPGPVPTPSGRP